MFRKILVAIDGSKIGQQVFDEALTLAKSLPASMVLLNVLSPEDEASPSTPMPSSYEYYLGGSSRSVGEIYQELWQNYADRELEMLKMLTDRATEAGVDATFCQNLAVPVASSAKLLAN